MAGGPDTELVEPHEDASYRTADHADSDYAFAVLPWWANRRLRQGLLLACLLAAVLVLLDTRGSWFGIGGGSGAQAGTLAIAAGCPGHDAPQPRAVATGNLGALRALLSPTVPARVGRVYESGAIETADLWSDDEPQPLTPRDTGTMPAGYEIRWWALNREGAEDDVVAEALEFATARQAQQTLKLASSPRCRRDGASHSLPYPRGASELRWLNPDKAREWDVLFARGRRLYEIADAPPEYLFTTTAPGQAKRELLRDAATPRALACTLPVAGCPRGAVARQSVGLASRPPASRAAGLGAPPSRARAIAYAHAVNLRDYHLPGLSAITREGPASDRDYWEAFAHCTGELRATSAIVAIRSPLFRYERRGRYEVVYSTVVVFADTALADRYFAALATPRARSCITRAYRQRSPSAVAGGSDSMRLQSITAAPLATPVPRSYRGGAPYRATALRLTMQAGYRTRRGRRGRLALFIQGFAFADGRAVVELASLALPHELSAAEESFLEATLVGRAEVNEGVL